jgi:hypothetical protein
MQSEKKLNEIVKHLKYNLKSFPNPIFPTGAGIYAIGFDGDEFPLASATHIKNGDIIYVGKAETDLKTRDIKTHFKTDKSGSSTLRRSLGAILREKLKLTPIARSYTEKSASRFTNYKFTSDREQKLTDWMKKNLSLSYWEWQGSVEDLRKMEPEIIKKLCPILNLQNNPCKKWISEIKGLRTVCRDLAKSNKNLCK